MSRKFVNQAGFSHAWLANHRQYLAVAAPLLASTSLLKTSISVWRPTNGVNPRLAQAWIRVRAEVAPISSCASTGREIPFACTMPSDFT